MRFSNKIFFVFLCFFTGLWAVEIDSLEGIVEAQDYIQKVSFGDTLKRERTEFEKKVEGDSIFVGISDSIPLVDEDAKLDLFRQNFDENVADYIYQDKAKTKIPLFLYSENVHYYSQAPIRQDVQFEELSIHPLLFRKYQYYQDYRPFWDEHLQEGNIYFTGSDYNLPVLTTKALLGQGYNNSNYDQAVVNIYKGQVYNCLDFHLGFNGSDGYWLSSETREKTKDVFGSFRYYFRDFFSLEYSYLFLDHDLPSEKLFFTKINTTAKYDSLLDAQHIAYKSQQHYVVFKSIIFDAGYSYSYSDFSIDSVIKIDKKYDVESYFYAIDLDFWGQNLAVGRKSYNNFESTKIEDREYYKGKLNSDWWYGTSVSGYYDETNTSINFNKGLPWGFSLFCDYVDKENQAVDSSMIVLDDIMFSWIDDYKSSFFGLEFNNRFLNGRAALGKLEQKISEHTISDSVRTTQSAQYSNTLVEADMKVRLPFSLWGQKMALAYGLEARKFLTGDLPYSSPELQMLSSYELIFYFKYGNVLTLGQREYYASDFYGSFSDLKKGNAISSAKILDYYLKLDLTKQFTMLMDLKNYDKDESYMGVPIYRRHFKINFTWYLFD